MFCSFIKGDRMTEFHREQTATARDVAQMHEKLKQVEIKKYYFNYVAM